ncbi:MAG: thioredoxin family protein [Planctomycetota bacterium]
MTDTLHSPATAARPSGTVAQYWDRAVAPEAFLDSVEAKRDLWHSYAKRARLHADEAARAEALPGPRRILVLVEDWCGDAIRSTPAIVALADASPGTEVRFLDVGEHPGALDGRTTAGARAIPIVVVDDGEGNELGQWGPRPAPLQAELRRKIREEGRPTAETKGEFYAPVMAWYAKDRGRTVGQELLMLLERTGSA